jgi:hypothetical protein
LAAADHPNTATENSAKADFLFSNFMQMRIFVCSTRSNCLSLAETAASPRPFDRAFFYIAGSVPHDTLRKG